MPVIKRTHLKLFLILIFLLAHPARADENLFGYISGADTLPKGAWEVYQWATYRDSKYAGAYNALDLRTEFEHGLTDSVSTALYLNFRSVRTSGAAPMDSATMEPEWPDRDTGIQFQGMQLATKFNVLSVYKDPIGLSFYFEPGFSQIFKITGEPQKEYSLELKIILQKNFLEDQLVWAFNLSPEWEWREFTESGTKEKELALEATTGLSYRFIENWNAGLEARYHSEYPDMNMKEREHYGIFLGPNIHYGAKTWWFTLTYLPQITGGPSHEGHSGNLHLNQHEKSETRLKIGYNF